MDQQGNIYPLIPFNLIIDTDIGLYRVIAEKYKDPNTFGTGILEASPKYQLYHLYNRTDINPLYSIAVNPNDKKTLDEYYEEFMEEEYTSIVENSPTTRLYNIITSTLYMSGIHYTILCKNKFEEEYLKDADKSLNMCTFRIGDYTDTEDIDDPVYFKYVQLIIPNLNFVAGRNLYIAGYGFNINDKGELNLSEDELLVLNSYNKMTIFDPYNRDEDMLVIRD